jgi:hypothetical protein
MVCHPNHFIQDLHQPFQNFTKFLPSYLTGFSRDPAVKTAETTNFRLNDLVVYGTIVLSNVT